MTRSIARKMDESFSDQNVEYDIFSVESYEPWKVEAVWWWMRAWTLHICWGYCITFKDLYFFIQPCVLSQQVLAEKSGWENLERNVCFSSIYFHFEAKQNKTGDKDSIPTKKMCALCIGKYYSKTRDLWESDFHKRHVISFREQTPDILNRKYCHW